jgi:hypothetical protein
MKIALNNIIMLIRKQKEGIYEKKNKLKVGLENV